MPQTENTVKSKLEEVKREDLNVCYVQMQLWKKETCAECETENILNTWLSRQDVNNKKKIENLNATLSLNAWVSLEPFRKYSSIKGHPLENRKVSVSSQAFLVLRYKGALKYVHDTWQVTESISVYLEALSLL